MKYLGPLQEGVAGEAGGVEVKAEARVAPPVTAAENSWFLGNSETTRRSGGELHLELLTMTFTAIISAVLAVLEGKWYGVTYYTLITLPHSRSRRERYLKTK